MRRALPALLLLLAAASTATAQTRMVVVSGLGGEPQYSKAFHEWALSLADAAQRRFSVPADHIIVLGEKPDAGPRPMNGRSTREAVLQALKQTAQAAAADDAVVVVLIGHGSSESAESRLSLPGPDLTAQDLATALDAFRTQKVVVVNTASASGGFIEPLSGRNRAIITATQSQLERNEAIFGRFFVAAFAGDGADTDKDGRVSMLEAFDYARREVEREYREDNRLLTEHALLDDNGDGKGSREPAPREGDGSLARTVFLTGGAARADAAASPEVRALLARQRQLEGQVEELKARKDQLPAAQYEQELEKLLLELARVGQQVREKGGTR